VDSAQLIGDVFALSPAVRYVAVRSDDWVELRERPDLRAASSSDRLRYLTIGYGNFTQLVVPARGGGHVSVAFVLDANPLDDPPAIIGLVKATD
jgi:hypothetical protein